MTRSTVWSIRSNIPPAGSSSHVWGQKSAFSLRPVHTHRGHSILRDVLFCSAITESIPSVSMGHRGVAPALCLFPTTWSSSNPSTWTSKTTTVTTYLGSASFTTIYTYSPSLFPQFPGAPLNDQDPHPQIRLKSRLDITTRTGSLLKTVTKQWRNERLLLSQTNTYPNGLANETVLELRPQRNADRGRTTMTSVLAELVAPAQVGHHLRQARTHLFPTGGELFFFFFLKI